MPEREWDLRRRTLDFAVAVFRFSRTLAASDEVRDAARQLRRAAGSVAANYRALCRSSTDRVFVAKASTVIEEADECAFWLEFMVAADLASAASTRTLAAEAHELVAIFVASRKTATARMGRENKKKRSRS